MKFLSLNIHSLLPVTGLELTWEDRLEILCDRIIRAKYEVIAFQEINQSIDSPKASEKELVESRFVFQGEKEIRSDNAALDIVKRLRERGLRYYWTYSISHIGYDRFEEGTAILSLFPPSRAVSLISSHPNEKGSWTYRRQTGLVISYEGNDVALLSVHFGWWQGKTGGEGFKEQWNRTCKLIEALKVDRVFLLGDFNGDSDVKEENYDYITNWTGFFDGCSSGKYRKKIVTAKGKIDGWDHEIWSQLDYIFSDKPFITVRIDGVFNNVNEKVISDHYGIEGELLC